MRVIEYFNKNGSLWNNSLTYPNFLTSELKTNIEKNFKLRFAFHNIRKSLLGLADDLNMEDTEIIPEVINNLMISNDYKYKTLIATMALNYDPIENYRMTETEDIERDTDKTLSNTETLNHSDANTINKTDTITFNTNETLTIDTQDELLLNTTEDHDKQIINETNEVNSVWGFNSESWNHADKKDIDETINDDLEIKRTGNETTNHNGTNATAKTGTETTTHTGTDTTTHTGTIGNSGSESEDEVVNRTLTRAGNIGVTTSQQMIESEREVALFNFIDIITADIVNELCICVV